MAAHFRAAAARLLPPSADAPERTLTLPGRIDAASYPGDVWRYTVEAAGQRFLIDDVKGFAPGAPVRVAVPADGPTPVSRNGMSGNRSVSMQLTLLGVGEAFAPEPNSSALVEASGFTLLIDCGHATPPALWRARPDPDAIDAIYLTHHHADHVLGLVPVIDRWAVEGRRANLTIYTTIWGIEQLRRLFEAMSAAAGAFPIPYEIAADTPRIGPFAAQLRDDQSRRAQLRDPPRAERPPPGLERRRPPDAGRAGALRRRRPADARVLFHRGRRGAVSLRPARPSAPSKARRVSASTMCATATAARCARRSPAISGCSCRRRARCWRSRGARVRPIGRIAVA